MLRFYVNSDSAPGVTYTLNGTLNDPHGVYNGSPAGVRNETVTLQKQVNGGWIDIGSVITGYGGAFSFTQSEATAGTYTYRVHFAESEGYSGADSNTVTVSVG